MTKAWWSMDDLINESNESRPWIMTNMIKNEKVWDEIENFPIYPNTTMMNTDLLVHTWSSTWLKILKN